MAYVCETLSAPAILTGYQTCTKWVLQQTSSSFLPDLSTADRDQMIFYFVSIFAVVFVTKAIQRLL